MQKHRDCHSNSLPGLLIIDSNFPWNMLLVFRIRKIHVLKIENLFKKEIKLTTPQTALSDLTKNKLYRT